MKKALFYITTAALATSILSPAITFGQAPELPTPELSYEGLIDRINQVANFLFAVLVVLTVIFLIWAAWKYLNGDAEAAKGMIINAAIAIAIGLLARGLPLLVRSLVGVSPGEYQIPG